MKRVRQIYNALMRAVRRHISKKTLANRREAARSRNGVLLRAPLIALIDICKQSTPQRVRCFCGIVAAAPRLP